MSISGGYRSKNLPVSINGTFAKRVQSFNFNRVKPHTVDYEMGNEEPAGVSEDAETYGGTIAWNPIDNQIEALMMGFADITSADPKGMLDFSAAAGVIIKTPKDLISGAKLVTLSYSGRVGGPFTATMGFDGTGYNSGSTITIVNPSGVGAYRMPKVNVDVDGTDARRALGFDIQATFRVDRLFEIGTETPVAIDRDTPQVTVGIDFVESDSAAGNSEALTIDSPGDIEITIGEGSGAKRLTVLNAIWQSTGPQGSINGYATRRYNYISRSDSTYGGLKIDKTA